MSTTQHKPDDLLRAAEAAGILGVSNRRVQQYAAEGRLEVVPVHDRLQLYTRASVERLARQERRRGRPRRG